MRAGDKVLNFNVTRRLKAGGMGVVFEGEQNWGSRKRVAIKQLLENLRDDDTIRRRFIREAEILEMLDNPRIVKILGFDPDQDAFVMEFVEGKTLSDTLRDNAETFRQPGVLVAFFVSLLDAFSYAHTAVLTINGRTEKGIVHRDIKPSNIIVQPDGFPKILDFGISRVASFQSTLTDPKLQMGSVPYMSPEQIATPTDVDWRSDIYSLGVTLWEMLAARSPYPRVTTHEVVIEVQRQIRFEPLPSLIQSIIDKKPEEWSFLRRIDQIIAKATAKDRVYRYQHCNEMKVALQKALNDWLGMQVDEPDDDEPVIIVESDEPIRPQPNPKIPPLPPPPPVPNPVNYNWLWILIGLLLVGFLFYKASASRTNKAEEVEETMMADSTSTMMSDTTMATDSASTMASDQSLEQTYYANGEKAYYGRDGVTQDYTEAVKWYRMAADRGYVQAQSDMGYMYQEGKGVTKSYVEAANWYRLAANQGWPDSQLFLAWLYETGNGVKQSYSEAIRLYGLAADQGNANAQNNLAFLYHYGKGTEVNLVEAFNWYSKSAEKGYAPGQYNLGSLYENGIGVESNMEQALFWYRKAAAQDNADAKSALKRLSDNK